MGRYSGAPGIGPALALKYSIFDFIDDSRRTMTPSVKTAEKSSSFQVSARGPTALDCLCRTLCWLHWRSSFF